MRHPSAFSPALLIGFCHGQPPAFPSHLLEKNANGRPTPLAFDLIVQQSLLAWFDLEQSDVAALRHGAA